MKATARFNTTLMRLPAALLPALLWATAARGSPPVPVSHWAPRIYHDTAGDYRDDYLTRFDFDGDWDGANNLESFQSGSHPLMGAVYYAVIETETHWYITYAFFHPYDSSLLKPGLEPTCLLHENDMEGVILTIHKDGSPYGTLRAMATEAHGEVYYLKPPGSNALVGTAHRDPQTGGGTGPDSTVYFPLAPDEPAVFIEADGHGVGSQFRAMVPASPGIVDLGGVGYAFIGGDGIVYYHDGSPAGEPSGGVLESVPYELRTLDELWNRRHDGGAGAPYCGFADFLGNRGCRLDSLSVSFQGSCSPFGSCAANPPWGWESDASGSPTGEWFLDPAYVIASLHLESFPDQTLPGFDRYVSNVFLQGDRFVEVDVPASGAPWEIGETEPIAWTYLDAGQGPDLADSVAVELSRDGGPWELLATAPITDGSVLWTVTSPAANACRIRVTAGTDCVLEISGEADSISIGGAVGLPETPPAARVLPARPNPFRTSTVIGYELADPAMVSLRIYDVRGRLVRTLLGDARRPAARHEARWQGRDDRGRPVAPGRYLYRLEVGGEGFSGSVVLYR